MAKLISADELYKRRGVFADDIGKHGWREAINNLPAAESERTQDAIDRQAAIEAIADTLKYEDYGFLSDELESVINNVSAADVRGNRHGEWKHDKDDALISGYCSHCGWQSIIMETDVADMPYCPNCGADMRGET